MDSGADAAGYRLRAGKCRRGGREGRSLLGRVVLSVVWHVGPDHTQTDQWLSARYLWLGELFGAILYPRQRSRGAQTLLALAPRRDVARSVSLTTRSQASFVPASTTICSAAGRDVASYVSTALRPGSNALEPAARSRCRSPRERLLSWDGWSAEIGRA